MLVLLIYVSTRNIYYLKGSRQIYVHTKRPLLIRQPLSTSFYLHSPVGFWMRPYSSDGLPRNHCRFRRRIECHPGVGTPAGHGTTSPQASPFPRMNRSLTGQSPCGSPPCLCSDALEQFQLLACRLVWAAVFQSQIHCQSSLHSAGIAAWPGDAACETYMELAAWLACSSGSSRWVKWPWTDVGCWARIVPLSWACCPSS